MIAAFGHDVYCETYSRYPDIFRKAIDYINKYGYKFNNQSKYSFPFEIKSEFSKSGETIVFLEESIIKGISNHVVFKAYGRRTLPYSDKELVLRYLSCREFELNKFLDMFRMGNEYSGGKSMTDNEIYTYIIEKLNLIEKYQK